MVNPSCLYGDWVFCCKAIALCDYLCLKHSLRKNLFFPGFQLLISKIVKMTKNKSLEKQREQYRTLVSYIRVGVKHLPNGDDIAKNLNVFASIPLY
jgi:hypothetical protein